MERRGIEGSWDRSSRLWRWRLYGLVLGFSGSVRTDTGHISHADCPKLLSGQPEYTSRLHLAVEPFEREPGGEISPDWRRGADAQRHDAFPGPVYRRRVSLCCAQDWPPPTRQLARCRRPCSPRSAPWLAAVGLHDFFRGTPQRSRWSTTRSRPSPDTSPRDLSDKGSHAKTSASRAPAPPREKSDAPASKLGFLL